MALRNGNKVIINWRGVQLATEQGGGEKKTNTQIAAEHGKTTATLSNWEEQAPPVVEFIVEFMKEHNCTFDELIKEVKS